MYVRMYVCMYVCICLLSLRDSKVEAVPTKILARGTLKRVECYSPYYRNYMSRLGLVL